MKRLIFSLLLLLVSSLAAQAAVKTVQFRGLAYAVDTERKEAQLVRQSVTIKGNLPIPEEIKYKVEVSVFNMPDNPYMCERLIFGGNKQEILDYLANPSLAQKILDLLPQMERDLNDDI